MQICLHPSYLIPIVPQATCLRDHALVFQGQLIQAILPSDEARLRYPTAHHIDLPEQALMPGMVNLHGHSAMTLLRGLADDLALMDWLNNHIWPAEKAHVSDHFVYEGSLIAMAEMLAGGTTTINDMYFHHDAVARAGLQSGMRTVVGCSILEFPTNYGSNATDYINHALQVREQFQGETLLQFRLAPHAPYTVADDTFKRIVQLRDQHDWTLHCHIHESRDELNGSIEQHGMRPLQRLDQLGVLDQRLVAAHMVHVNDAEIALLAQRGVHIAHNPASNLKLASGFAPIQAMLDAGVNVGLGTDGAASNNQLDMLGDMRLAALLAKAVANQATALSAHQALYMATMAGAKALGLGDQIGSLEVDKQADMISIDLSGLSARPLYDAASQVVYTSNRQQVCNTWVAGRQLLKDRQLCSLNYDELLDKANWWQAQIRRSQ